MVRITSYNYFIRTLIVSIFLGSGTGCTDRDRTASKEELFIGVLGITQDAGYPQIGCEKECCQGYWKGKQERQFVASIALFDKSEGEYWLFDATPDIREQLQLCNQILGTDKFQMPKAIFLTHAHIGHYTGLMELGKEAIDTREVPVYCMPRMKGFLENSGPWSQLVNRGNISLIEMNPNAEIGLKQGLSISPFLVPHRDEYSETVGYEIRSRVDKAIFIPDIDKWNKWERSILEEIKTSKWAFLDGSFFSSHELPGRDMSEIPHPSILESLEEFKELDKKNKSKIRFIHFNHSNPLINKSSPEYKRTTKAGFGVCRQGEIFALN